MGARSTMTEADKRREKQLEKQANVHNSARQSGKGKIATSPPPKKG